MTDIQNTELHETSEDVAKGPFERDEAEITPTPEQPKAEPKKPARRTAAKAEPKGSSDALAQQWGGGSRPDRARGSYGREAVRWQKINETRSEAGCVGFDGILIEDAYRAASLDASDELVTALENMQANVKDALALVKKEVSK